MAKVINLPKIGVNMTEAVVVEWVVSEGDETKVDQHILSMEADKDVQDIHSSDSGVILKILRNEGDTVLCQEPLYIIGERGEDISELLSKLETGETSSEKLTPPPPTAQVHQNSIEKDISSQRTRISPLAKKFAKENNIDFHLISPAAPGSRIVKKDVQNYLQGSAIPQITTKTDLDRELPLTGIRRTIAERMTLSASTIPSSVLNLKVNAEELLKWKEINAENGNKISLTDIIIKAASMNIKKYPMLNARFDGNSIMLLKKINIGVAVDTERGLMVPVIHQADQKGVLEISKELRQKTARARSGQVKGDDMTNGTFTITNMGMLGIEQFIPIINPPQCAILAVGSIEKEVIANDKDEFQIQRRFWLSLAFDHRIIDGAPAGRYLNDLKKMLEGPLFLAE